MKAEAKRKSDGKRKTQWRKLNEQDHRVKFVEKDMTGINERQEETWTVISRVLKETGK